MARSGIILLALAAALVGGPASAQRRIVSDQPYVHGPARAVFAQRVGEFRRSEIYRYDPAGADVSASYNLATPAGRLLITVYIYPAATAARADRASACGQEFAAAAGVISTQHGNAAPIERGPALAAEGAESSLGHRAVYRFASPFDDRVQPIRSEIHLYCYVGGDWLVKYRVSAPVAVETRGALEDFIREGPWPGRSST